MRYASAVPAFIHFFKTAESSNIDPFLLMGVNLLPYPERIEELALCLPGKGRANYQGVGVCAVLSAAVLCLQAVEKLLETELSAQTLLALHLLTGDNRFKQALIDIGSVEALLQHELGL